MVDNKLAIEEAQRAANYEALKSSVKTEVESEIVARADVPTRGEAVQINNLAGDFRQKAIEEVVETDREVERGRTLARVSQVVDYIFYVIYSLLAIRLLLALFAARESAGFVQFIKSVTDPFYAPFRGIVPSLRTEEGFTLALPIVIALVVYALLHLGINGLLRIFAHRKTAI
ncbi:MAG TPA: YggT family protein [Pyrinomonadaceae bacterium]|nr:YggT family protein [Pyrinomonadaceae bacterium]